jgi:hypothetical protein
MNMNIIKKFSIALASTDLTGVVWSYRLIIHQLLTRKKIKVWIAAVFVAVGCLENAFANGTVEPFGDLVLSSCKVDSINGPLDQFHSSQELIGAEVVETSGGGRGISRGFDVRKVLNNGALKLKLLNGSNPTVFPYETLTSVQSFPFYQRFESGGPADRETWVNLEIYGLRGIQDPSTRATNFTSYQIVLRMAHMNFVGLSEEERKVEVANVLALSFFCSK